MAASAILRTAAIVALAQASQQPQFKSRVDLVQVDVVVTDRRGTPITGLKAEDFTILEGGRPQTISQFASYAIPLGERRVERGRPPVPVDIVTNTEEPSPRAIVIFVDSLHMTTDAEELDRTRRGLTAILSDASPGDDVAIVFANRSDLSVPFTRDLARQMQAIESIRSASVARVSRSGREAMKAVEISLWTMRNAISVLRGSDYSRRVILYVGEGSFLRPEPPGKVYDEVRMTLEAATRAGVVIHAIDPRGVLGSLDNEGYLANRAHRDFLSAVTLDTGGSVVQSAADTRGEIRKVMEQNGTFYVLGFEPAAASGDGFRPIEVKVRNPAWRVRARKGYYPPPRAAGSAAPPDPARVVREALESGVPARGVALTASASSLAITGDGRVSTLVTLDMGGEREPAAGWELAVAVLTPDGKVLGETAETLPPANTPGPRRIHRKLDLRPGVRPVRVVVRDRDTGAVGAVHLALEIPDLADEPLSVGGIMIGTRGAKEAVASGLDDFVPATARVFAAGSRPALMAFVFWKGRSGEGVPVTARVMRGAEAIASSEATLQGTSSGRVLRAPFNWHLPALASGSYVVELSARRDGKTSRQAVPFVVR